MMEKYHRKSSLVTARLMVLTGELNEYIHSVAKEEYMLGVDDALAKAFTPMANGIVNRSAIRNELLYELANED